MPNYTLPQRLVNLIVRRENLSILLQRNLAWALRATKTNCEVVRQVVSISIFYKFWDRNPYRHPWLILKEIPVGARGIPPPPSFSLLNTNRNRKKKVHDNFVGNTNTDGS